MSYKEFEEYNAVNSDLTCILYQCFSTLYFQFVSCQNPVLPSDIGAILTNLIELHYEGFSGRFSVGYVSQAQNRGRSLGYFIISPRCTAPRNCKIIEKINWKIKKIFHSENHSEKLTIMG